MSKRILIVEDEKNIVDILSFNLGREGYDTLEAYDGEMGLKLALEENPDLILLDLMLPGLSGEELLARIRGVPVIVVSARADLDSKVSLLLGGAADYVTKPFQTKELLARIAARLREAPSPAGTEIAWGPLRLDAAARAASAPGGQVRLTPTECAILKLLMGSPGQVITKSLLLDRIALDTPDCTETSLKMHVSNLRRKLREAGAGDCIEAVWGIGFRLRDPEEDR